MISHLFHRFLVFLCLILFHLNEGFRIPFQMRSISLFQQSSYFKSSFSPISFRKPLLLPVKNQFLMNFQDNDDEDDFYSRKQKNKQIKAPEKKAVPASPAVESNQQLTASGLTIIPESSIHSTEATSTIPAQQLEKQKKSKKEAKLSYHIRLTKSVQPTYAMMALQNVELSFGGNDILKNASLAVSTGERVGLVGPNGIGKVT
jgi:ABC-type multidrug transport system fused ATPase/permease subunit